MVACDFFVVVTATFRTLYVFVILELGSRRVLHHNVAAHPTAAWTLQRFREALPMLIRIDSCFTTGTASSPGSLNKQVAAMGVRVLPAPVRAPKANSLSERFGGSM